MTIGEDRVRIKFNPSSVDAVSKIKQQAAALIDLCNSYIGDDPNPEKQRCLEAAMDAFEDAAMWAVKGVTFQVDGQK